jgi:DNA-binding CsgD family transcriptional regulator
MAKNFGFVLLAARQKISGLYFWPYGKKISGMIEMKLKTEFFHPRRLAEYVHVVVYFAASLFCIMSSEFITSLKTVYLFGASKEYLVYGVYSVCVAAGAAFFYLFCAIVKDRRRDRAVLSALFTAGAFLEAAMIFVNSPALFAAIIVCLYFIAGFNTGIVSFCLYRLYLKEAPAGRILSAASLIGLSLHYLIFQFLTGTAVFPYLACATMVGAVAVMYSLIYKIPIASLDITDSGARIKTRDPEYSRIFFGTIASIALVSFIIGMSDSLVAKELPANAASASFFYPALFYIPGQTLACLLADVKKGKYLAIFALVGAILLIPVTLWLKSPEEVYLNASFNFFVGGFFLAYIMTSVISIASRARNRRFAVCVTGIVYPLFCGVGGFLTPFIIGGMGFEMIVIVYSAMIALLAALSFSRFSAPAPALPSLEELTVDYGITNREMEVLRLLVKGKNTVEIAEIMGITDKSVRNYISSLLSKTYSTSRGNMIAKFAGKIS